MIRSKRLICLSVVVFAMVGLLTACSAASSSSTTTYTYGNASPAVLALSAGMLQAAIAPIPTVAYTTGLGTVTFHFAGYYSATNPYKTSPYTLTGSLVEVTGVSINGTVNFTGGVVTQITYNNVTSAPSGTYQITFVGALVYTYNLATGTFTLS